MKLAWQPPLGVLALTMAVLHSGLVGAQTEGSPDADPGPAPTANQGNAPTTEEGSAPATEEGSAPATEEGSAPATEEGSAPAADDPGTTGYSGDEDDGGFVFDDNDPDLVLPRIETPTDSDLAFLEPLPEASPMDGRWVKQYAFVWVGVGGAEDDAANPVFGLDWSLAEFEETDDPRPLAAPSTARRMWGTLNLHLELGGGLASAGLPTAGLRLTALIDRDAPRNRGTLASLDARRIWAPMRWWRNVRLGRANAVVLPVAGYAMSVRWQERAGVSTHFDIFVSSPGYSFQSAMGRAGTFHGAQILAFELELGPRVVIGPRAEFVYRVGAQVALAAGVNRGSRTTIRSEANAHMRTGVEIVERFLVDLLGSFGVASDSFYGERRQDWTFRTRFGVAF